jgi:hypothetical protein
MSATNGGPAFPITWEDHERRSTRVELGMTLRDYFATTALQGILSCPSDDYDDETLRRENYSGFCDTIAESAYNMADAMLKAREVVA